MDLNPDVQITLSSTPAAAGATACDPPLAKDVFFVAGGAFTSGGACKINGNILANGAITAGASGSVTGKSFCLPHLIPYQIFLLLIESFFLVVLFPFRSFHFAGSLYSNAAATIGAGVLLTPAFTSC